MDNRVSWQMLAILGSVALTTWIGALWIGSLSNQISTNSGRLSKLEEYEQSGVKVDADMVARMASVERRLNRLEQIHPDTK